ncbi:MAG: YbhB/YbcL family Raf kinase inhibitor-like protein [Candidatus Sericytochromatia bacterium]|nr:YbhB/YbcL family Raf kinase inhibitor-like protein [Candidatus Sericytochromatia bacterium]
MKNFLLASLVLSLFACQTYQPNDNVTPNPTMPIITSSSNGNVLTPTPQSNDINFSKPVETSKPTTSDSNTTNPSTGFKLSSSDFIDGGDYPKKYTCDGASASPSLSWSNPPAGTVSYALTMHHIPAPGDEHVYMVVYDIPSNINMLASNEKNIGKWGINTVNGKTEYTPPCSKGPGPKSYILTLYALSESPNISSNPMVTKAILTDSIKGKILGTSTINVTYSRG